LWLLAAAALFALFSPGRSRAADDTAIAYDQIERVIPNDAIVPGPDAFAIDEEETRAAIAQRGGAKRGLARIVASLGHKGGASDTLGVVADDLQQLGFPRLERHVFYRGWERIENLSTGIVVLRKCDLGMQVTIDPGRRTYRVEEPLAADRARLLQQADRERPGGATLQLIQQTDPAQALTIGGVSAAGYRGETTLRVQAATGSCRVTTINAETLTYYSTMRAPISSCPHPAPDFPATPLGSVARDGCRPSVTAQKAGATEPSASLVLYRLLTLTEGQDRLQLLTARGNVREIADPAQLFAVPSGYAKAP
jgi:hypothetical protein